MLLCLLYKEYNSIVRKLRNLLTITLNEWRRSPYPMSIRLEKRKKSAGLSNLSKCFNFLLCNRLAGLLQEVIESMWICLLWWLPFSRHSIYAYQPLIFVHPEIPWPIRSVDGPGMNVSSARQPSRMPLTNDSDKAQETIFSGIGHLQCETCHLSTSKMENC